MHPEDIPFSGFKKEAAKKSERINKLLKSIVATVQSNINFYSSTPKSNRGNNESRMEISFTKFCQDAINCESNLQIMDYDSGYMSHNQESNSDSSIENVTEGCASNVVSKPIFLSEDALLETPELKCKHLNLSDAIDNEDYEETRRLFNSPDVEVVNSSITSSKTTFSGFSNDSNSDSDESVEIPLGEPIIYSDNLNRTDDSANSTLNETDNMIIENQEDLSVLDTSNTNTSQIQEEWNSDMSMCTVANQSICDINTSQTGVYIEPETENSALNINSDIDIKNESLDVLETQLGSNIEALIENHIVILNNVTNFEIKPSAGNTKKTTQDFNPEDKENMYKSNTPMKNLPNPVDPKYSPDLFNEEPVEIVKKCDVPNDFIAEEKYITKKDHRLLKRVQTGLSGVLPPPSVTTLKLSVSDILIKLRDNKEYFWTNFEKSLEQSLNASDDSYTEGSKSLLISASSTEEFMHKEFPHILQDRYHGLHYNRSKISEEFELLCAKFGQRCVGSETQSSCTVFENATVTPGKKKIQKSKWVVKSPGRRLSHLARRRITFSSANLQAGGSSMAGLRAKQIMIDARKRDLLSRKKSPGKSPRKTPKKTPNKSPRVKTRTPSSSAKKKLAMRFRKLQGEIEKTVPSTSSENFVVNTKRALFQSPSKSDKSMFMPSTSGLTNKGPTKRALFTSPLKNSPKKRSPLKFSPFKKSPSKIGMDRKRKRLDSEESQPSKFARSVSVDIRPSESEVSKSFIRSKSELNVSKLTSQTGELSDLNKKKLQWAVYEALRSHNITPPHAQFKVFASILARVTRKFFLSSSSKGEAGTTERMLRLAKYHVYAVLKGKSVDEIINEYLKNRAKLQKPQGYVGIEEFKNKENILQDRVNTLDSVERKKLEQLGKPKAEETKVERIRKVINFGDDDNR